jgi:hypothetical protein
MKRKGQNDDIGFKIGPNASIGPILSLKDQRSWQTVQGVRKLMGENLKLVWPEFSTISSTVLMMCINSSIWMHAHIYSWKLSPGLVLLAKVIPWTVANRSTYHSMELFTVIKVLSNRHKNKIWLNISIHFFFFF